MLPDRTPVDLYAPVPPRPVPVIDREHIARLLAESRSVIERTRAVVAASYRLMGRVRADAMVRNGFSPDPPADR